MLSTCRQFECRQTNDAGFFSFKLNTDSFVRSIYYNISMQISYKNMFRKLINLRLKSNFKHLISLVYITFYSSGETVYPYHSVKLYV